MINYIVRRVLKKNIVLYIKHRQTRPIIEDAKNKQKYVFIDMQRLISLCPIRIGGRYKLKEKYILLLLRIIHPLYILNINWLSKWDIIFKYWTNKTPGSSFIVVQHGAYCGGIVTDNAHKYINCDIFLTWSKYFTDYFKKLNPSSNSLIFTFGNPVYNIFKREKFEYKVSKFKSILIAPTLLNEEQILKTLKLAEYLKKIGFWVTIKEHAIQGRNIPINGIMYPEINYRNKINGKLSDILRNSNYDIVISGFSTALLDAIYFKKFVLLFDSRVYELNEYNKFLRNIYYDYEKFDSIKDVKEEIDIEAQEKLLKKMILFKNNNSLFSLHLRKEND